MRTTTTLPLFGTLALFAVPAACAQAGPVEATRGMVSSGHPRATQAGVAVLERGGNAFDAAVAVAATLFVVEPYNVGPGGYGTILLFDAEEQEAWFLNASGRFPRATDSDVFRPPAPSYEENRRGPKAISTPVVIPALEAMHERYGTAEWSELFEPAIAAAEDGFEIGAIAELLIAESFARMSESCRAVFGADGEPLEAGARLVQKDLARSLRKIAANGADEMRRGELARAIDAAMRAAQSFLRLEDLEAAEAEWWEPIRIDYRGCEILTASPPATSFPGLVRLGIMSRLDPGALGHNSAGYLHRYAEVTKHAFWCRLRYAGDPQESPPPLERLLAQDYWTERAAELPERATTFAPPGPMGESSDHTTHFVVADSAGNVVSATLTLGQGFGSGVVPAGTGIWLNNSMQYCTFEPAGNPMDARPGQRKRSGDFPAIVLRDGRPWIAIGAEGGHTISQTVPQMIMNVIDFGMDLQAALDAPRISFYEPNRLLVERGIDARTAKALAALGHDVRRVGGIGTAHALAIERDAEGRPVRFVGAADPRGEGQAAGVGDD